MIKLRCLLAESDKMLALSAVCDSKDREKNRILDCVEKIVLCMWAKKNISIVSFSYSVWQTYLT